MVVVLVVVLGACTALAVVLLPAWLSLGTLGCLVAAVVALHAREGATTPGAPPRSLDHGVVYLAGCFALLPFTGVHLISSVTVGQAAAAASLGVLLADRSAARQEARVSAAPLALAVVLLVGGAIAGYWNATADSLILIGELVTVVLPLLLALRWFAPTPTEALSLMKGWLLGVLASTAAGLTFSRFPSGRSVGFASHPNQYGMQVAMALAVVWALRAKGRLGRWTAAGCYLVLLYAVLASGARSALLAAALGGTLLLWRSLGFVRTAAVWLLTSVVGVLVLTSSAGRPLRESGALGRLLNRSATANSDQGRLQLMQSGLARVNSWDRALLGGGWVREDQPHNLFLLAWDGAGLMGLVALAAFLVVVARRAFDRRPDPLPWALAVCALTFLAAASVNNALTVPFAWGVFALLQLQWSFRATGDAPRTGYPRLSHVRHVKT